VGGELLICDKNQTVGCSALVRSSFYRTCAWRIINSPIVSEG
jgi:hypothetical protein